MVCSVCVHVRVCVWSVCGVCAECECDQKQTSLPLGPFTEYTRRQTAHTSLPWDCSPQGTRLHRQAYPWLPFRGTRVSVSACIYTHDSVCVSVHAYVRDCVICNCVVFQCTHMVACMIDQPSPGTLLKASTQRDRQYTDKPSPSDSSERTIVLKFIVNKK